MILPPPSTRDTDSPSKVYRSVDYSKEPSNSTGRVTKRSQCANNRRLRQTIRPIVPVPYGTGTMPANRRFGLKRRLSSSSGTQFPFWCPRPVSSRHVRLPFSPHLSGWGHVSRPCLDSRISLPRCVLFVCWFVEARGSPVIFTPARIMATTLRPRPTPVFAIRKSRVPWQGLRLRRNVYDVRDFRSGRHPAYGRTASNRARPLPDSELVMLSTSHLPCCLSTTRIVEAGRPAQSGVLPIRTDCMCSINVASAHRIPSASIPNLFRYPPLFQNRGSCCRIQFTVHQ